MTMHKLVNFIPLISQKVSWRKERDGRAILCQFRDCQYHIYELDSLGAFIWELCDKIAAFEKIFEVTLASGKINLGQSEEEILEFLLELENKNLLKFENNEKLNISPLKSQSFCKTNNKRILCRYLGTMHTLSRRPELPLEAIFEVTKNCNRSCLHCYVEKQNFVELSIGQLKIALDKILAAGVLAIHFTGGEPFLREDFLELIEYIRKKNIRVQVDTNGILLNEDLLKKIKALDIDMLNIGFDGSRGEIYGITRNENDFAKVKHNIQLAVENGIQVVLFFCLHKSNLKDLFRLYNLAIKLGVGKLSIDPYQPLNKGIAAKERLSLAWPICVLVKLYALIVSKCRGKSTIISWDRRCNMGLTTFGVHPDGTVSPCVAINKSFGSALNDDLLEIWNGDLFNQYINPLYYSYPCNGCRFPFLVWVKKRYLGKCPLDCRAEIFTATGDIFSGNKFCIIGRIFKQGTNLKFTLQQGHSGYLYINRGVNARIEGTKHILLSCIKDGNFRYYKLNKMGGMILALCDGRNSVFEIGIFISERFGLRSEDGLGLVKKFLKKLVKKEIILVSTARQDESPLLFGLSNFSDLDFNLPWINKISINKMMSKGFDRLRAPLEVFVRLLPHSSTDKIKGIIDKIADARVLEICFSGKYVLDREDIVELVRYAKSKGLKASLYARYGNRLNGSKILRLKEAGLDIIEFSLDGFSAFSQVTPETKDDFQMKIENIKLAANCGLNVVLVCVADQKNIKQLLSLVKLAKEIGVKKLCIAFFKADKNEVKENLNNVRQFNFWGRRYVEMKVRLISRFSSLKIKVLVTCAAGTLRCCIDSEGEVAPCVKLPPSECDGLFGNVFRQELSQIWNSLNFNKFINPRSYGRPCSLCWLPYLPFFRLLPRCRADCRRVNYLESNDIFAGNQNCIIGKILNKVSGLAGKQ